MQNVSDNTATEFRFMFWLIGVSHKEPWKDFSYNLALADLQSQRQLGGKQDNERGRGGGLSLPISHWTKAQSNPAGAETITLIAIFTNAKKHLNLHFLPQKAFLLCSFQPWKEMRRHRLPQAGKLSQVMSLGINIPPFWRTHTKRTSCNFYNKSFPSSDVGEEG